MGPFGEVAWLCAPRWDSEPLFAGLVGATGGSTPGPPAARLSGVRGRKRSGRRELQAPADSE
ncbi:hypothetical protein [Kitasatospora sp. NPDC051164]|uniref:hypothetical protein n=1 Tax=Kitasatospora sp. NPDC051164 TaxID=3364055 RepID=UPI00378B8856